MYTNVRNKGLYRTAAIIIVISALMLSSIIISDTSADDVEYAQSDDISVSPSVNSLTIDAGSSATIYLDIHNKLPYYENDPNTLIVYIYFQDTNELSAEFTGENGQRVQVDGQGISSCEICIHVDKYAKSTEHKLSFDIYINDPDRGSPIRADASDIITINIQSELSASETYNKILGIWDNNLPGFLGTSIVSALLSLILWIAFAVAISFYLWPLILKGIRSVKNEAEVRKIRSKEARRDEK